MTVKPGLAALGIAALSLFVGCGRNAAVPATPAAEVVAASSSVSDAEAWAKSQGLLLKSFDLSRDGRPDIFKYYRLDDDLRNPGNKLEVLVRKDTDINHDGKIDIVRAYDDKGQTKEERDDLDFDGRFDEVLYFEDGVIARKEVDLDYDGKPEITKYFGKGKLVRIESDRSKDGRTDAWEYYENETLDRIGLDTNFDGVADTWQKRQAGQSLTPADGQEGSSNTASPAATSDAQDGAAATDAGGVPSASGSDRVQ